VSTGALALTAALLVANGFFVAVEFAVLASRTTRIEPLAATGNRRARLALHAMRDLNTQLAAAQLGITMASLLLGFVAERVMSELVQSVIEPVVDLPPGLLHAIGFGVGLAIVVFLHMLIGEMVPKNIAIAEPERTLLWLVLPNRMYLAVFRPVVWVLNRLANGIVRLFGVEPRDELATARTAEEIASIVGASRSEGLLAEVEHQLLTGALDLGESPVAAVVIPIEEVTAVPRTATPAETERVITASGHSRVLVFGRDTDDVLGFVHAKDLLDLPEPARGAPLPLGRVHPVLLVGPDSSLTDVLLAMQRARLHVAVVSGAGGRGIGAGGRGRSAGQGSGSVLTRGIVTLEDVLEALVGDIRDESDPVR
jgi:CBS domain containing-hemolysin-like protein